MIMLVPEYSEAKVFDVRHVDVIIVA
jgi:hypothetical protein